MTADPIALALELHHEAEALQSVFRLEEAEARCRRSLALFEEHGGSLTADVANILNTLASICEQRANYGEAALHAVRAVSTMEWLGDTASGAECELVRIEAARLLGTIRRRQGRYPEAETLLLSALTLAERIFPLDHPCVIGGLNNLAVLYKYTGAFDQAENLYTRARAIIEATQAADSLELATIYHNLGGLDHARERYQHGEPHARRAYEIRLRRLGPDHPDTAADAAALAGVLDGLGRHGESEPLYTHALKVFERHYGPEHYEIAVTLNNLAAIRQSRGDSREAERLYRQSLAIKAKLLGAGHHDAALTANNLALALQSQGKREEAGRLLDHAIEALEATLDEAHPSLDTLRKNRHVLSQNH